MKRTPLKKMGKKGLEWVRVRNELKKRFVRAGITRCELKFMGCWGDNALGFAHLKKRRNLIGNEIYEVVLACNPCHDRVEVLPEEEMKKILSETIKNRKAIV